MRPNLAFRRVLPKALSWIFERKYKVVFRIGRIGLLTFKLFDVHVLKNGYAIVSIGFKMKANISTVVFAAYR